MPTAKVSLQTKANSLTPNTLPNSNFNTALDLTVNADQQNQLITPINDSVNPNNTKSNKRRGKRAKNKATQSKTINKPTISPKIRKVNKFTQTHNNTGKNSINPISTEIIYPLPDRDNMSSKDYTIENYKFIIKNLNYMHRSFKNPPMMISL